MCFVALPSRPAVARGAGRSTQRVYTVPKDLPWGYMRPSSSSSATDLRPSQQVAFRYANATREGSASMPRRATTGASAFWEQPLQQRQSVAIPTWITASTAQRGSAIAAPASRSKVRAMASLPRPWMLAHPSRGSILLVALVLIARRSAFCLRVLAHSSNVSAMAMTPLRLDDPVRAPLKDAPSVGSPLPVNVKGSVLAPRLTK